MVGQVPVTSDLASVWTVFLSVVEASFFVVLIILFYLLSMVSNYTWSSATFSEMNRIALHLRIRKMLFPANSLEREIMLRKLLCND